MKHIVRASLLASAVALLAAPVAFAQTPVSDAEFKCQAATSKGGVKFVGAKSKCVQKCLASFWKGTITNDSDCLPPYGGATYACIVTDPAKPGKSAEEKFEAAIRKACDVAANSKLDCPECSPYNGDCDVFAPSQVGTIEGQVDSFVPGVGCERAGATKEEQKCQTGTAKALTKQVGSVVKCYDKCKANERKGTAAPGSCDPPASDGPTQTCVSTGNTKAALAVDKVCPTGLRPDCPNEDDYGGNDGNSWANLVDIAISGNIPTTYCTE
jgi:hypothetical protein